MPDQNTIVFINEEVNEVLGKSPGWFVKWGNVLFLLIVALLVSLSAVLYYPETIAGRAEIVPSGIYIIKSPGYKSRVKTAFVKDGDTVKKGARLYLLQPLHTVNSVETIVAPCDGLVQLQRVIKPLSLLDAATPLVVIKSSSNDYKITIYIPAFRAGKITPGQKVHISPHKYPKEEYGELVGGIVSKPLEEKNGMVQVEAVLFQDAVTNYGNHLDLNLKSLGSASIIIERRTIFSKLFPF